MPRNQLKRLSLKAQTTEDLSVISGSVQDSILQIKSIIFNGKTRSLTLALQRYRYEVAEPSRISSALRFDDVLSVKSSAIDKSKTDAFLVLLSLEFTETDKPSGLVTLNFSGGGKLIVEVECLEVMLLDQGLPWVAKSIPDHSG